MMLATRGRVEDLTRLRDLGYTFDLKIDGVRCHAKIAKGGVVTLWSRAGVNITTQYPEIVAALSVAVPHGDWEFDGEIAVNNEAGLPSWPLTAKRNAQTRQTSGWAAKLPATFYLFDMLTHDGDDVRSWTYERRREMLNIEMMAWASSPHLQLVLHSDDPEALWDLVNKYDLEGIVAKRLSSTYRDKRTPDWVKVKRTSTVTCMVGGFEPGEGSRAGTFGALLLYLIDDQEQLVPVGKVGSGFSNSEVQQVMARLSEPPLIVEVEYLDFTRDGVLRQPVFQRIRTDAAVTDCTLDQLTQKGVT